MKKAKNNPSPDGLSEPKFDWSKAVRGKYYKRVGPDPKLVKLPDAEAAKVIMENYRLVNDRLAARHARISRDIGKIERIVDRALAGAERKPVARSDIRAIRRGLSEIQKHLSS